MFAGIDIVLYSGILALLVETEIPFRRVGIKRDGVLVPMHYA
jgi:hypothetical protein